MPGALSSRVSPVLTKLSLAAAVETTVQQAAAVTNPMPTPAQCAAGNYRKGRFGWHGIPIAIENARGSLRVGKDWSFRMKDHYGYLVGARSQADGDPIDVFVATDDLQAEVAFVINQNNRHNEFDEHKAVIGVTNAAAAEKVYRRNYPADWRGFRSVVALTLPQFRWWIKNADTAKALDPDFWLEGITKTAEEDPAACGCGGKIALEAASSAFCSGCGKLYFDRAERLQRLQDSKTSY